MMHANDIAAKLESLKDVLDFEVFHGCVCFSSRFRVGEDEEPHDVAWERLCWIQ